MAVPDEGEEVEEEEGEVENRERENERERGEEEDKNITSSTLSPIYGGDESFESLDSLSPRKRERENDFQLYSDEDISLFSGDSSEDDFEVSFKQDDPAYASEEDWSSPEKTQQHGKVTMSAKKLVVGIPICDENEANRNNNQTDNTRRVLFA